MSDLSRREFAEAVALAALAPLLWPGAGSPSDIRAAPVPGLWSGAGSGATAASASRDPRAVAQSLVSAIRAQYGGRLSEADLVTVTRQIEAVLERADRIRKVQLANGDEPDFVFSAVRSAGTG